MRSSSSRLSRCCLGLVGVLVAVAAVACSGGSSGGPQALSAGTPSTPALHGAIPSDHALKPSFRLVDTSGKPYDFAAATHGKATLLYFGYTHCPDECPTAMADVAAALRRTDPAIARQVDVVFVTTDPWRDSKRVLRKWLDRFSPSFIGLTGSPTQVAAAEVAMGMPIAKREAAPKRYGSGKYAVNHFAAVLAYGRDDRVATLYPSGITPAEIAADLPVLVKG
ncbi:MAG TPA: SCO family protein [Mycobacteriales bacterium]|nr:SCO family protein [Mycobacteriales bacterium]